MSIRKAESGDLSRIAEIYVFNNRINYFPIFKDEKYSFGEMQVVPLANNYFGGKEIIDSIYVYDDGVVKGFMQTEGAEICKLYVDVCFQNQEIGDKLIKYAVEKLNVDFLWALEKNTRAIAFYNRHGFKRTGAKKFEEGTTEYIVELKREPADGEGESL